MLAISHKNLRIFSIQDVISKYPPNQTYDPFALEQAHIPYTNEFYAALSLFVSRNIYDRISASHKVIVVDCDNTLWVGNCGESKIDEIIIDPSHQAFQMALKKQVESGKLLCIASKNNEEDIWAVFDKHPDMILSRSYITIDKINWQPKSTNIISIADELNLSLDSFIFIDDNPIENVEVNAHLPQVLCLQMPKSENKINRLIHNFWPFDTFTATEEDKKRSHFYKSESARKKVGTKALTFEEYLINLNLTVTLTPAVLQDLERLEQLTIRTNQFNINPKHYNPNELKQLIHDNKILMIHANDRFGDYGNVGAIIYNINTTELNIIRWWLSCRALGRGVEFKIVNYLGELAQKNACTFLRFHYENSGKNNPARQFLNIATCTNLTFDIHASHVYSLKAIDAIDLNARFDYSEPKLHKRDQHIEQKAIDRNESLKTILELDTPFNLIKRIENNSDMVIRSNLSSTKKPDSELEHRLCKIWQKILRIQPINLNDDFFNLSGDSLKATFIVLRIYDELGVKITIADIFKYPTIKKLADLLASKISSTPRKIMRIASHDRFKPQPISFAQSRIWFLQQLEPCSPQYNMFIALKLTGVVDTTILEQSLKSLVERHESLRTTFTKTTPVYQIISLYTDDLFKLEVESVCGLSEKRIFKIIHDYAEVPFDLAKAPLFKIKFLVGSENTNYLLFCMHHIILDGWSFNILTRELSEIYNAQLNKRTLCLPNKKVDYIDFVKFQNKFLHEDYMHTLLSYWKTKLNDAPHIELPYKANRVKVDNRDAAKIRFDINNTVTDAINDIVKHKSVSMYTVLISVYALLLAHYSSQDDIVIGSPIYGRHHQDANDIVGFFINIIALRFKLNAKMTFNEYLQEANILLQEVYEYQDAPFEKVIANCNPLRTSNSNPLTQTMFIFQNHIRYDLRLDNVDIKLATSDDQLLTLADFDNAKFDLSLYLQQRDNSLVGQLEYSADLFDDEVMKNFVNDYVNLLKTALQNPDEKISIIPYHVHDSLSKMQPSDLMVTLPEVKTTVINLFEEVVNKNANLSAIKHESQAITYHDLNLKANCIAQAISKLDLPRQSVIAIPFDRSIMMVAAILGIFKSGNIYLLIDNTLPIERINYVLSDANVDVILHHNGHDNTLNNNILESLTNVHHIYLDQLTTFDGHIDIRTTQPSTSDLAYIVYTSGTTGTPKGIRLTHSTLVNLISWQIQESKPVIGQRTAQIASTGFDVSLQEIFFSLCSAQELYIIDDKIKKNMPELCNYIYKNHINYLFLPTLMLNFIADNINQIGYELSSLKEVIVAGDQLVINESIRSFFNNNRNARLVNHYGPAETHVVTSYRLPENPAQWPTIPPIGNPIKQTNIFILNKFQQPVPAGVKGEIYITGPNLAKDYLNKPEMTETKFINLTINNKAFRCLRTGDYGYWLNDNNIQYTGRNDNQLKIHGYRVEISEIEHCLDQLNVIEQSAVIAKSDKHHRNTMLIAYIVPAAKDKAIDIEVVKHHLKARLPNYMIPADFIVLSKLPYNSNGKIEKSKLPKSLERDEENNFDPTESFIANIFAKILNLDVTELNRHSDFFTLGGHSLLLLELVNMINKQYRIQFELKTFYENPVIGDLAAIINHRISAEIAIIN